MNQPNRKMRIGVLGAGGAARDLHLPVLINMPHVSVSWVCDKDEQRARQLAKYYAIPAVFTHVEQCSDVDIVLVAIPVGYRPTVMEYTFCRGWHAFCEKPFAVSLAEHDQYLVEARENKVQVGVGLVRRYSPATIMAKKIVCEGYFGPVVEAWASEGTRTKRTGKESGWYMADPKIVGGGVLMETGSHLVDQLCTILNISEFRIDRCIQRKYKDLEFETRFIGAISTDQQRDIRCTFEVSLMEDLCNGIFIEFSNFILKCGLFFEEPLEMYTREGTPIARFDIDDGAKTIGQALFLEWQDFIDQCISGNPCIVSANTARQSTAIIEQCYQIAEIIDVCDNNVEVLRNE